MRQFYTAPTLVRSLEAQDDKHVTQHDRSSLRILGTVGEPINPRAWMWFFEVRLCQPADGLPGFDNPAFISRLHLPRAPACQCDLSWRSTGLQLLSQCMPSSAPRRHGSSMEWEAEASEVHCRLWVRGGALLWTHGGRQRRGRP